MKVSIIVPVYYNEDNLLPLYEDIKKKVFDQIEDDYEMIMVDDGSGDNSYQIMQTLASRDNHIRIFRFSRNFGSHAAMLCGLEHAKGDCAVIKAADLQEPSELILEMVESWRRGNHVVLGVRAAREEGRCQIFFANLYYWLVRKTALSNMPRGGFDVYLLDRKVIQVLSLLDEKNSALTGQILWSGFRTERIPYVRKARENGRGRWTLGKKIKLVADTMFSFSTLPIRLVEGIGVISFVGAVIWGLVEAMAKLDGHIPVSGWTSLFIFQLLSFGVIMLTLGMLGEYLWRTFDASRNRPPYLIEDSSDDRIVEQERNQK